MRDYFINDQQGLYLFVKIEFGEVEYFNGVKGKRVRWTRNFMDAKRHYKPELSERDTRWLRNCENTEWIRAKILLTEDIIDRRYY